MTMNDRQFTPPSGITQYDAHDIVSACLFALGEATEENTTEFARKQFARALKAATKLEEALSGERDE